jgi:hypothetical protein
MCSQFIGLRVSVHHCGVKKNRDNFIPKVRALADYERYLNMIWTGTSESTPVGKLRAFAHALGACWSFFVSGLPAPFDSGADEITPCKVAFLIVALISQRLLQ